MVVISNIMRLKLLILPILFLAALVGCKKEPAKPTSSGTFMLNEVQYPISMVRVEHVDYTANNDFVLRFTAYPASYKIDGDKTSGYGAVLNLYFTAADNDFAPGTYQMAAVDSLPSTLTSYPNTADGPADTTTVYIANGTLTVEPFSEPKFQTYTFALATADADSLTGQYTGLHTHNRTAAQPAYGNCTIDTIQCQLAKPHIINWGKLFGPLNYSEITFYSTDAMFTDKGALQQGVQLAVGLTTDESETPDLLFIPGAYPVATNYTTPQSALYGHKLNSTAWGTHWQLQLKSASGKANITEGEVNIESMTDTDIALTVNTTDQLKKPVKATYSGPYIIK